MIPTTEILAPKVRALFFDSRGDWIPSRYKVMHGGRGGLKSWGFARVAVFLASIRKTRFLCSREYQNSIEESVHHTICSQIEILGLDQYFDVTKRSITSYTGSEFIFAGLRTNPAKIKSTEGVDIAWIEEGEKTSDESLKILIPTIRKPRSEIWVGFNPDLPTDPVSQRFIVGKPPPRSRVLRTSWRDNPWLSDELRAEKDYLARVDPDAYAHVWEGEFRTNSAAQIFAGKCIVSHFVPQAGWDGPYFGADWGFSQDPTTLVKCWIHERKLYIESEVYGVGIDIDRTPALFDKIPDARNHTIRADSARPETISYMQRHGYPRMQGAAKWAGSVEDGITAIRSFEKVVIHTSCPKAFEESQLYSYKTDRLTGDVLPDIIDKHNHVWDAVRYALQPIIKGSGLGMLDFMRQQVDVQKSEK